jgi:uncharacterized membrane protein HdeD (DUF308 family)
MLIHALDKIKQQTIISSLIMVIVGLLMLVIPEQYDGTFVEILGYTITLIGGVMIWDFIANQKNLTSWILFTAALLLVFLGIYVLLQGQDILKALSVIFGILLILDGLHSTIYAWVYARRSGRKWWWILLILCLLLILSGIVILNNPWWHSPHSFLKVIGGTVLFAAVAGIIRLIMIWPIKKA